MEGDGCLTPSKRSILQSAKTPGLHREEEEEEEGDLYILSFILFLRDSHFNCLRMPVILPVSYL